MNAVGEARYLKLMADYECYPLWEQKGSGTQNVDPEKLPISQDLRDRLDQWSESYNKTLDLEEPKRSGFRDQEAEKAFKAEAHALLERLRFELGGGYVLTLHI